MSTLEGFASPALVALICAMPLVATALPSPSSQAHKKLSALFGDEWEFRLREDPLFATAAGDHRYDDRLPSVSYSDEASRAEEHRRFRERLLSIDRGALDDTDRVSYDLFKREMDGAIRSFELHGYRFPITADSGFHTEFARLPEEASFATTGDYENYLARLRAFPRYVHQNIELLQEGIRTGWTIPRAVLNGYEETIRAHLVDDPARSAFWKPFAAFPPGVPESERDRLRRAASEAIRTAVVPGYREFFEFMTRDYIPAARESVGASDMVNGRDYYDFLVHHFTTLDLPAEEIHRLGLEEVHRIRAEMEAVIRQTGFDGGFAAFLKFLRTDRRFYAKTPEELLEKASRIAKRADGKLPSMFRRLPRQPYGVEAVPADIAPKYTGGRYVPAPLDSKKAATYWVNTYALETRPLYTLESLTLHEAVPGHHLQIALAKELSDLPPFRRYLYVDAFGEGWGLYCERLGREMGFYTDPYSNFGRLSYEMWRACRLVVDTGLHAMGWTRQRAIDYLAANTALSLHEVATEVDRYISWPGQALAYKMGERTIRELRSKAEKELGERFDVREFHDSVLSGGTVTLPILERRIDAYIRSKQKS